MSQLTLLLRIFAKKETLFLSTVQLIMDIFKHKQKGKCSDTHVPKLNLTTAP